ncbi:unnamed protein product [Enterobius vermicularis]|uniref:SAM-dependent MTase TRM10-type domain-containing protein n=1 Tax=Enterobius vermicularis TaxID=51028 RepID=A0A0N4VL83_ENTVE|nr:unnamed protein product [Enterobius vermicularis]
MTNFDDDLFQYLSSNGSEEIMLESDVTSSSLIIVSRSTMQGETPNSITRATEECRKKIENMKPSEAFLSTLPAADKDLAEKIFKEVEIYVWMSEFSPSKLLSENWTQLLKLPTILERVQYLDFLSRKEYFKTKKEVKKASKEQVNISGYRALLSPLRNSKHIDLLIGSRFFKTMRLNEKPQMVADVRFLENDLKSAHISTLGRQMKIIIQENSIRREPFLMTMAGFPKAGEVASQFLKSVQFYDSPYLAQKFLPVLTKKSVEEIFPDRNEFVYISRHAKRYLEGPLDKKAYVFGLCFDYGRETLGVCRTHGFDIRRLPIEKHVKWVVGPKIIPYPNIVRILDNVYESNGDWGTALLNNISKRHLRQEEEQTASAHITREIKREQHERFDELIIGHITMGRSAHRDDRRRRDHDRSRSRERRHHHSEERKHPVKSSHSSEKQKDVSKNIEAVRSHMRSALDSVVASTSVQALEPETAVDLDLSATEAASRHREIERIEEGAFRPAVFQSTAGGAGGRIRKEDASDKFATVEKKQVAHDKAIFGAKWQDLQKREVSDTGDSELYIPESKREVELAGPKFFVDVKVREEKWLKLFRERRSNLMCS